VPRTSRSLVAGHCFHVLNRGNRKERIFHGPGDYDAFITLARASKVRTTVRVLAWCLMPNHFHMVLWPAADSDVSRFMHWLMTTHAARYHRHHGTGGRLWQGRFKAFPVKTDDHLLTVLRYVERNPLRAGLVSHADAWPWSSLRPRLGRRDDELLDEGPLVIPPDWPDLVGRPLTADELEAVRLCARRGRPYGDESWTLRTAIDLGLESSIRSKHRSRGRSLVLDIQQ
jgi:putative transposase